MESWLREGRKGSTAGVMRGPYVIWEGTDIGRKAGLQLGIVGGRDRPGGLTSGNAAQ